MPEREDLMDNAGREEQVVRTGGEAGSSAVAGRDGDGNGAGARDDARMAWWREGRVGLFVHWGLYSLPGGIWQGREVEASYAEHVMLRARIPVREYERIAAEFRAERFDARRWARLARVAGLTYLIYTAKHHDGFAMYDSAVSDYNIVRRTPFGRDPLRELAEACRDEGIKLCIYYSHAMDWHHPDSQGNTWDYPGNIGAYDEVAAWIGDEDKRTRYERYLRDFALPQVKELLETYGDIGVMWFDCGHKLTAEQGEAFIRQVREVQPDCLVNRRVWKEPYGDYGNTSDNQPHVRVPRRDWESIATLNDSWGYKATDHNWKTAETVLRQMIDVVSLNGNFVINVGPMGDGSLDPKSVELLGQIGAWMRTNGEAIYGTQRSPIGKPPWGRCTLKDGVLYAHVFDWPQDGKLLVPGLSSPVVKAYALADPQRAALSVQRVSEDDVVIGLPEEPTASCIPVIAIEFAGPCAANPVPLLQAGPAAPHVFGAFDADIAGPTLRYDTGKKDRDNLIDWCSTEDVAAWTFRAGGPGSYKAFATYGADAGNGAFELAVVSRRDGAVAARLSGTVRPTGGPYEFASFELGDVVIPATGEYVVRVKATAIPSGTLMCLKNVTLRV